MATEIAKRDPNRNVAVQGVSDDANLEPRTLRIDPATGRLKVESTISGTLDITGDAEDLDSGAGTDDHEVFAIGVAASGGHAVITGDVANGLDVDVTRISGTVTVDGSGVTQPISAASLPLPSGASTAANQATEITSLQLIDDAIHSEAGALSKGMLIALDDGTDAQFAQANASGHLKIDISTDSVGIGGGTQYTEDAVAAADPVGNAQILVRDDSPVSVAADGDNVARRGTAYGAAYSQIVDSSGSFVDTFGGGTQYTEGDTDTTVTGTAAMMEVAANTLQPVQGTVADGLLVNLGTNNDVTVTSGTITETNSTAILADTAAMDTNLAAINAKLVTGTVIGDVNLGATDNAVLDTIASPVATISATPLQRVAIFDAADAQITSFGGGTQYTEDAVVPANPIGTAMMMERDDALGGLTPAAGDWTHPFANARGALWVELDLTNDVTIADGGNAITVDWAGTAPPIGAGTEAAALRVTLATDSTGVVSIDDNSGSITVDNAGTFATQATLQAGTAEIGKLAAGVAEIGNVKNSGTFATQVDGDALTALQLIDDPVFADDAAFTLASSKVMVSGGIRDDTLSTLTAIEGDAVPLRVNSTGALHVTGAGGGTQYTDTDTDGTPTGTVAMVFEAVGGVLYAFRQPAAGDNSTGTGILSNAIFGQFDDVAPTTIAENRYGTIRMSSNRNMYTTIRDAAGNERGLNIDASGNITANLGATDNAVLDSIDTATTATQTATELIDDAVFADDAAFTLASSKVMMVGAIRDDSLSTLTAIEGDSVPFRVSSTGALHVTGGGGGTEYTEDVATANPIVGSATLIERDDALTTVTPIEGDWIGLRGTAEGALWTQDFNSDAILSDTTAILADTANMDTNLGTVAGAVAAGQMQVDIVADGAGLATSANQLPDGHNVTVDNATIAVTQSGTWDEVGINDSGNSITVDNAGTFATQVDGAALTALQLIDDIVFVDDTATHSTGVTKGAGIMAAATPTDGSVAANDIGMLAMSVDRRLHVDADITASVALDVSAATVTVDLGANNDVTVTSGAITETNSTAILADTANMDTNLTTLAGAVAGTEMQVDIVGDPNALAEDDAHVTGDPGYQMLAVRKATPANLSGLDGDYEPLQVSAGRLWVDASGKTLTVDGSGVTQPVSGTVTANLSATDNAVLDTIDAVLDTINAKLVTGTVIGDVNLGATDNAVLDSIDTATTAILADTAAIQTAVEIIDDWDNAASDGASVSGDVAHDTADAGEPVKVGYKAVDIGAAPTEVAAGDRTDAYADRQGVPFFIGGHPLVQTASLNVSDADGAQTDTAIITVSAGTAIVVTALQVVVDEDTTAGTQCRIGFGTANTPALDAAGLVMNHSGIAPGSGVIIGNGGGIIGMGASNEDLRVTCADPTGGNLDIVVTYYTVAI